MLGVALLLPLSIALVTWLARELGANPTTAGFAYLITVLLLATWGGWAAGAVASLAAMLCYNYFFLPPFGTFTISEPANWVALASFLAASTLASRLVASARRQAAEAQLRRREVEILYELCFGLFATSQGPGALAESATRTLRAIGAEAGALYLGDGQEEGADAGAPATQVGEEPVALDEAARREAIESHQIVERSVGSGEPIVWVPLQVGGRVTGVLAARGDLASRAVLEPAGRLLALAIERERLLNEAAHLEAARQSDALKTSLLRAVSHDLRTPLTAIRLETESLERQVADRPAARASLRGLALEQERLARRIDNLLSLARLEAGVARPHPEPVPPSALFRTACESLASILAGREVAVRVEADCPDLWADPSLTLEILVNLLENAARLAPLERPIEVTAAPSAATAAPSCVRIEVRDRGPGLPEGIRLLFAGLSGPRHAAGASGDSAAGGLGLRIARNLTEINGGTLTLLDRPGGGTIARLELPAAVEPSAVAVAGRGAEESEAQRNTAEARA
jgi:two-component system sensor histidine kinase KdpD